MASSDDDTPASTVAGNIDLLTSILTRLEAKPLIRFKSVSKQWLSLISSPRFSRLHTLQNPHPKPSALFFPPNVRKGGIDYAFVPLHSSAPSTATPPFGSLRFGPDPQDFRVSSSSNGLLLCSPCYRPSDRTAKPAYIYNPTTKNLSVLTPPPTDGSLSSSSTRYSLAFDPSISPHYKVIMVRSAPGTNAIGGNVKMMINRGDGFEPVVCKEMFEIHIYSSETQSWKQHEQEIEWPSFYMFNQGIYSNGAMHWASKKNGFICFDIAGEFTRPMPEPPSFKGWDETVVRYFGESGGDLYLVDIQGGEVMEIDVYVLEKDYSKWSQKYQVDMNLFCLSYPRMISEDCHPLDIEYYNFTVLGILQVGGDDDDDDDGEIVLHVTGKVISYGFKTNLIKELRRGLVGRVNQNRACYLRSFEGHLHSETLACV